MFATSKCPKLELSSGNLAQKADAFFLQLLFEFLVILDDPVMYDIGVGTQMRVGIEFRRLAVRRPAGMPDRDTETLAFIALRFLPEILKFPDRFEIVEFLPLDDGDTRRVVTAVFQLLKSVQQYLFLLFGADIAYDSTHLFFLFLFCSQFVNNKFGIMTKVSILFDKEHVPYPVFERMHFCRDDIDPQLVEKIDDIGQ